MYSICYVGYGVFAAAVGPHHNDLPYESYENVKEAELRATQLTYLYANKSLLCTGKCIVEDLYGKSVVGIKLTKGFITVGSFLSGMHVVEDFKDYRDNNSRMAYNSEDLIMGDRYLHTSKTEPRHNYSIGQIVDIFTASDKATTEYALNSAYVTERKQQVGNFSIERLTSLKYMRIYDPSVK